MDISKDDSSAPSTFARGHLKQWDLALEWRRTRCPWQAKASKCPRRPRLGSERYGVWLEKTWQTTSYIKANVPTHISKKSKQNMFFQSCVSRFLAPLSPIYWFIDSLARLMAHCHAIPTLRRAAITPSMPYLRSAICAFNGAMGHGLVGWPRIL